MVFPWLVRGFTLGLGVHCSGGRSPRKQACFDKRGENVACVRTNARSIIERSSADGAAKPLV